jgi:hypothetical protein
VVRGNSSHCFTKYKPVCELGFTLPGVSTSRSFEGPNDQEKLQENPHKLYTFLCVICKLMLNITLNSQLYILPKNKK